jgi:hypothetical protein
MKSVKFIAVLLSVGILALGLTTQRLAQSTFGQKPGPQSSQPSGDTAKNKQEEPEESVKQKPAASFGQKLGPQSSQLIGDLATNLAAPNLWALLPAAACNKSKGRPLDYGCKQLG